MGNAFDQFDAPEANPFDQFDAKPEKSNPLRRLIADPAISLLKGVVSVPEAAVGLADLATGGQAGKLAEEAGFRPKEAKNILDEYLSPEQRAANANLKQADGFVDTLGAVASNPSVVPHAVLESLPLMGAGGVVARALPVGSAVLRGALGEGIAGMGSSAESIRQESDDGLLSSKQALAAGASGAGVAAFGAAGGKLAQRMGIGDVDTLLAGGVQNIGKKGLLKSAASGALSEGVLEELPQSVWEQGAQNIALDRPLGEGVGQAAAMGLVTGAAMGAGGGAIGSIYAKSRQEKIAAEPQPEIAGLLPAPTLAGTPNDQMLQAAVARQNEVDAAQKNADEIYAERAAYEQAMQALYPGGATITADLVPLQQKIDDLLGVDQTKLKGLARVKYQKDLEKAFGEVVGITQDDNGREIPLTLGVLLDSQATAEQMAKQTLAVRHTEQQTAARLQQLADEESTIQPDAIPVVGPLSAAANQAVQTGVTAQVQMQQAAEQVAQAQTKAPKNKQDQAADPGPLAAIAAPSANVLAQNAPDSVIPAAEQIAAAQPAQTSGGSQTQPEPVAAAAPVRAYPKGQATMLAGRLTRQGFPSEVYPHPTIADAYAIRVAQGENNGAVAEQAVPQVAAQGTEGRRADAPGSADVSLSAPAGNTERTGDGAEVAASGVRQAVPAGTTGAQSAPLSKKPRKQIDAGRDSLFVAIAKAGGMDTDELLTNGFDQNDITYQGAARVGKKSGVLGKAPRRALSFGFALPLHKKGGMSFDAMREAMQQYGYLPEGATKNDAIDLFRRELGGERVLTPGAAENAAETDRAAYDAQMLAEQERIDAERAVEDAIEEETGYADLSAEEQAHADAYDDLVFDEDASPQDSDDIAAGMRAIGFSEKEINDELAKTAETQGTGGQTDAGTSQEIGADRPGNGAQEVGARQGTGSQEAEGLTGQSNEEAAAQFAQQEETAVSKEQADRERDAVPFSLAQQSQPKPQGVQGGMFTPDGRVSAEAIDAAAHEAATSPKNDLPQPSEAQIEAGNYKKGHVVLHGLDIAIENPMGSTRSGTDEDGKAWSTTMTSHYGYIKRTEGNDGDHVDVFVGAKPESEMVFVVDQSNADGSFDEHKVMLGFENMLTAKAGYAKNYQAGWMKSRVLTVTPMSVDLFKQWLEDADLSQPAAEWAPVKFTGQLEVEFDGKRYPVKSLDEASDKWVAFREESEAGVSEIGNGIPVFLDGQQVARISYNGRVWPFANIKTLPAAAPKTLPERVAANQQKKTDEQAARKAKFADLMAQRKALKENAPELSKPAENGTPAIEAADLSKKAEKTDTSAEPVQKTAEIEQISPQARGRADFLSGKERIIPDDLRNLEAIAYNQGYAEAQLEADYLKTREGKEIVVRPGEFPTKEVDASYSHISHSGASRARSERDSFVETVDRLYDEAMALAETPEQKSAAKRAAISFKNEYLERLQAVIRVRSGTYSAFIAGRSGLNTKQANARNSALDRAQDSFAAWQRSAEPEIKQAVLDARNPEQLAAEQAKKDGKAEKARAQLLDLVSGIVTFKKGDSVKFGGYNIAKVSLGKDGYPSSVTVDATDLTDNKFDIARMLFKGDKEALRAAVDEVRADQATEESAPAASPEAAVEKTQAAMEPSWDAFADFWNGMLEGRGSITDVQESFATILDRAEEFKATIGKLKNDQLKRMLGWSARPGDKKSEMVDKVYDGTLARFTLNKETPSKRWSYGEDINKVNQAYNEQLRAIVNGLTDADLTEFRDKIAENGKARKAALEEKKAAVADPKTLEDFNLYVTYSQNTGKTQKEAYQALTSEQKALWDSLAAEKTRSERANRVGAQRSEVTVAATTTEGQIVTTKHTKTGQDLFVVKAAERVERDVYTHWNATAKRLGGWYSSFRGNGAVPGFQFKTMENAQAFLKFIGGDVSEAKEVVQERRDAYADDRSQSAVERLNEMAERLEESADASMSQDRKANTARRARFAASAEAAASSQQALAKTMRNIAGAIESGTAKFLDKVRQKVQVELLQDFVRTAKDDELRAKYPSYGDQEKHKSEPATSATAEHAVWPSYTMYRSDLANLGRKLIEVEGTKKIGLQILKVADDVSDAYLAFAKANLSQVMKFSTKDGGLAAFNTRDAAESAIARSGFKGKAVPYQIKRGEHTIIYSPTEAQERGVWTGDADKKITLTAEFGAELVEKLGRVNRSREKVAVPWQFETTYARRKKLAQMGIETNAEFRTALREFIGLREAPKEADKIKALERAMIGRKNDGLDFFPTPASTAQEMLDAADIKEGMSVLEPSAGMGHIAEQIREAGVEPDVVEMANDRKELLEENGFNVVGRDFMDVTEQYDRIIMNPPFSDRRDAQHVQHAYSLLKPGGRLVSIMGEGVFFGQDKKAETFRNWLEEVGGTSEKLPEGSFLDPSLPVNTGVNARMVVVDKPEGVSAPADNSENKYNVSPKMAGESGLGQATITPTKSLPFIASMLAKENATQVTVKGGNVDVLNKVAGLFGKRIIFFRTVDGRRSENGNVGAQAGRTESDADATGKSNQLPNDGNVTNGFVNAGRPDLVFLNVDSANHLLYIVGHELGHSLKVDDPALWSAMGKELQPLIRRWSEYKANQAQQLDDAGMAEELFGDIIGQNFLNEAFWQDMAKENQSLFARIAHAAIRLLNKALKLIVGQDVSIYVSDMEQARAIVAKTMAKYAEGSARGIYSRYAEGQKQTETPAFEKWFADSKVVDADGKPLVVYHGTRSDITQFDSKFTKVVEGIFFTPETGYASQMAIGRQDGANVMPLYVSLKNPSIIDVSKGDYYNNSSLESAMSSRSDGVIVFGEDGNIHVVIARDASQIKSAIGNNGDFDASNPDIRYNKSAAGSGVDVRYNVTDDDAWSVSEPSKLDDVIYAVQDKHVDTKRVLQAIKANGQKIADQIDPYLQEELFHGRATKGVKDFIDFELRPLLKEMQDGGVDMGDFEEYLWNRHAPERNAQIAKINPDMKDGGSGIKTAEARAYLANLNGAQRATFEALARRIDGINKGSQRVLVESGLEKQETVDAWNGAYQHYVPLQREDVDSGHVGTGKGFSVRGSSSKRAMGSGRAVVDIIANITMQRERNIVRAEKNRVSNALMGLAVGNPNADFWTVDTAPKERVVEQKAIYTVTDAAGEATEFTRMSDAEKFARSLPEAGIEQTWGDRVTERVVPGFSSRDNVLLTRINGEDHYIIFNERDERAMRMAQSLKNLDMDNLGRVLSIVGKATRYLASINTQYNPVFGVINLIRDAQGALINLSSTPLAGQQKKVFGYTKDALIGIYQDIRAHRAGKKPASSWAGLFEEFQKEGGQTGYRDQYANAEQRAEAIRSELGQFKEGKARQLTRGVFGWLSDYNETMENAVRLAAYKTAKEQGMSRQQAASLAKNITVNFNRKGQMATQVGALYAFFNASVQGSARLAETLFEPNNGDLKSARLSKVGKKIIAGGILLGTMQALLLAAAGFDDDEPPDFVRERNLILPIGGGKYLTLAMPLGFHVLPGIGRIATEFVLSGGKDPLKRIAAFASMFAESFNPIGSSGFSLQTITPSVVDPFAALAENRDFTGKEIYRENRNAMSPTPGHARAKDVATVWSRYLSESINWMTGGTEFKPGLVSPSPDGIDYLLGQLTGGVGREMSKAFQSGAATLTGEDLPLYKVPLAGRFVGDTEGQSGQSAKFYAAIKQVNMHEAEYKGLLKAGRRQEASEYLAENPGVRLIMAGNHAERAVQKLRAEKRSLLEKDAGKEQIRAIDERITETMRAFNARAAI
ncbi:MAG: LPD38 domain-containing protein [Rhodocyclaceae bacterium]